MWYLQGNHLFIVIHKLFIKFYLKKKYWNLYVINSEVHVKFCGQNIYLKDEVIYFLIWTLLFTSYYKFWIRVDSNKQNQKADTSTESLRKLSLKCWASHTLLCILVEFNATTSTFTASTYAKNVFIYVLWSQLSKHIHILSSACIIWGIKLFKCKCVNYFQVFY